MLLKKLLGEALWKQVVVALVNARIAVFITSKIKNAYLTLYMHKYWSSYYEGYILYYLKAIYKDSTRKQLSYFVCYEVDIEY